MLNDRYNDSLHTCMYVCVCTGQTMVGLRMSIAVTFVSHMYNSVPQLTKPLTTST